MPPRPQSVHARPRRAAVGVLLAALLAGCGVPGMEPAPRASDAASSPGPAADGVRYGGGDDGVVAPDLADVRAPATASADGSIPVSGAGVGVAGEGDVRVDVYYDPACPWCRTLELQEGVALRALVADGGVTLVHRPLAFLDARWGGTYSTRAVNALAHVADADPERYPDLLEALLVQQPEAGEAEGLDDDRIAAIAAEVGVDPAVVSRFTDATTTPYRVALDDGGTEDRAAAARTFAPWVAAATHRAGLDLPEVTVPTVLVDGQPVGDWTEPGVLVTAVRDALAERAAGT
ncbi:DsbA family protein [Cellulomonas triticagri]|uniref:Disulfide bond formation protein DsbA n=1 Tax=Cellulomonas triticagri TaxID=2483352 RepID=A0A3M2J4C3_9CELL|nr:thioredoxin domain-containing protein [Cellulomonas triticagri]RMI08952.1 disulfide bond formation protein DsbA [Cellulomonas triticagri]